MVLQRIDRVNGAFYVGDYQTVIDRYETDCDKMGPDGRVAGGRFRYSFELYEGDPNTIAPHRAHMVLIIETHDERDGSIRHGEEFTDVELMKQFVIEFDPCRYVAPESLSDPEIVTAARGCRLSSAPV